MFLSSSGDPFILGLTVKLWQERWHGEVDSFWINVNSNHCPRDVLGELLSTFLKDDKIRVIYHPHRIGNGLPIGEMTLLSKEDHILLLEDDGFIFTPGKVADCFNSIENESIDAVGSPRFSCGWEVSEVLAKRYGLDYSAYGDVGPNFWPNFFFCKREDLLKTDMNFGSKLWKAGEHCDKLDHTFKIDNHGDTFVWACVQLRAMGLRFSNIPQFHADPFEVESKEKKEMNWIDGKPFWIHGGSLSAGLGGYLTGLIPEIQSETNMREIESRVAWWQIASDVVEGFDDFKKVYQQGIKDLIVGAKLDQKRIDQKINLYRELMNI